MNIKLFECNTDNTFKAFALMLVASRLKLQSEFFCVVRLVRNTSNSLVMDSLEVASRLIVVVSLRSLSLREVYTSTWALSYCLSPARRTLTSPMIVAISESNSLSTFSSSLRMWSLNFITRYQANKRILDGRRMNFSINACITASMSATMRLNDLSSESDSTWCNEFYVQTSITSE